MKGRAGPMVGLAFAVAVAACLGNPMAAHSQSPGGSGRLAFAADRGNGTHFDIHVIALDGSAPRRLTTDRAMEYAPAWSPDGSRIAFVRDQDLFVMNADGSGVRRLAPSASLWPRWSPDGSKIVFQGGRSGQGWDIYVINADGSGERRLTSDDLAEFTPSFSPDGSKIVYAATGQLGVMDADGSDRHPIVNDGSPAQPAWSPDGRRIAFMATGNDGKYDIFTVNPDGTGAKQLTTAPYGDLSPTWSPDGRRIAFSSNRDLNGELYVMNADGGAQTRITHDPESGPGDTEPHWDPASGSGSSPLRSSPGGAVRRPGRPARLRLKLRVRRLQRVLRQRGLRIRAYAEVPGRFAASARIRRRGRKAIRLGPVSAAARPRRFVRLQLKLGRRSRARVAAALRRSPRLSARVRLTFKDRSGNTRSVSRKVLLVR